jgi:hydrogenase maturation factor HypF (carbamoyltransferase family)
MTSMAAFAQCPPCAAEYRSPRDRRFHAEPNACPACGPRLSLLDAAGATVSGIDPIAGTVARRRGDIVASDWVFPLACDARNVEAIARRERKAREESRRSDDRECRVGARGQTTAERALESAGPIVSASATAPIRASGVAPDLRGWARCCCSPFTTCCFTKRRPAARRGFMPDRSS